MPTIASRLTNAGTLLVNGSLDEFTGAPVVDTSLMLWLDAAQTTSYSGSGATWTDLSPTPKNYTLGNSPTFSSTTGGGAITFAGASSQYATSSTSLFNSTTFPAYTISLWVYPTGAGNFVQVDGSATPNTGYHYSAIEISAAGVIKFGQWTGGMTTITTSTQSLNAWYNLVITYASTLATAYVNGVSVGTSATTWSAPGASTFMALMAIDGTNMGTSGYASGSIGAFMVYNRALTAAEVTQNYNALGSRYGLAPITSTQMPVVQRLTTGNLLVNSGGFDEVSLAAGAISFNGTTQYLTATSPNLSGTWTVEMWCYWTTGSTQTTIVSFNNGSNSGINLWKNSSNQLVADDGVNGVVAMSTVTPTINAWNHIAFVRVGTTTSGYVNGVLAGTTTYTPGTTSAISVGRYNGSPFYYFPGYISNLRVVNGTAVYTAAFTPPQAILPAITNTSFLLNVTDSTNFIKDNSPNAYTITNNGTATWTATGPYNRGVTTLKQRQVKDGTLQVLTEFDEVTGMVVTSGMIAYIDAGQTASYPGTGTLVRDLVNPSTNPATLNGTITWVSAGSASYWNFATASALNYITSTLAQTYLDCTLVFYPDFAYTSGASLAYGLGAGAAADKTMRFGGANGTGPWTLQNPDNTDGWASTATTYYVNNTAYTGAGNLSSGWNIVGGLRTNTTSGAFASSFAYTWGTGFTGRYYQGRLAAIVLYNRQLTAAEQKNNYNYFAARYGLPTIGL